MAYTMPYIRGDSGRSERNNPLTRNEQVNGSNPLGGPSFTLRTPVSRSMTWQNMPYTLAYTADRGSAMARRDNGTGSVYRRHEARYGCPPRDADGNRPEHKCRARFYAEVDYGFDANGNRDRRTVSAATAAEVKVKLRPLLKQKDEGAAAPTVSARTTVKAVADEWLPIAESEQRAGPYRTTKGTVRNWIVPTIGHKRIVALVPGDWRAIDSKMKAAGLVGTTRKRAHSTFLSLLKFAQQEGHVVPANVLAVKPPAKNQNDRTDMSVDEAVKILVAASEQPDGSRWAVALLEAMRQGERSGLMWDHLDFERDLIIVEWQLQPLPLRVKYDRSSGYVAPEGLKTIQLYGRWHLVELKTENSLRVLPMVPLVRKALLAWKEIAPESQHGLVWPRPDGEPLDPHEDDAAWYALQDIAGVRHPSGRYYTIHEARHTTATLLLELEVPPEIIIAIMGHASMISTKSYLHVKTKALADALGLVEERLALPPAD
jgi:integrase